MQPGFQPTVVSDNAARWTPHVLDGYVSGFAESAGLVVAVGNFTTVRSAASDVQIPRGNIFAFQNNTGEITPLNVAVNGEIMDVLAVGDGKSVFIAGAFDTVNGLRARSIAKINILTGEVDTSFKPPAFDGRINQMLRRGDRLYVVGRFLNAGTAPRTFLAALDPLSGALIPSVQLDINTPRTTTTAASIQRADITPDGSRLVAIGNFTIVNGQTRTMIFTADLTTSPTSLTNWSTDRFSADCSAQFDSQMRDIDMSPDGSYFVVVTTGGYHPGKLCDTASRWELGTESAQAQPSWVNYTGGDTLTRVAVTQSTIYLGGHNRWLNNPFAGNAAGPGAVERSGLSAVDPRTGMPTSWNPGRTRGYGVYSFVATDAGLWIGSDTDRISNYQYHGRLAFLPLAGGFAMPTDNAGSLPGNVYLAGAAKDDQGGPLPGTSLLARSFSGTTVTGSGPVPSGQDWNAVRGLFMADGRLYSARTDGTLQMQTFDGSAFGAASSVNLYGLTDFATELSTMTGLFYDPGTGRLYYTLAGSSSLYFRYFQTQSGIPGASRFTAMASSTELKFANVRSMFLAGRSLYMADSSGTLTRWNFIAAAGGPVAGTGTAVSGPAMDGFNWTARDTFLFAGNGQAAPPAPPPIPAANQPPSAAFTASATDLNAQFDGTRSADADGTISSFNWTFGDGSTGTGATAAHTYAAAGSYPVTLTVTDNAGATGTMSQTISVSAPPPANLAPTAAFAAAPTGLSVSVDGSASQDADGPVSSYAWSFGDGATAAGVAASHTYAAAGDYLITLTVTDNAGASGSTTKTVTVSAPAPGPAVVFRAEANVNVNSTAPTLTVPAQIQAGDAMLLFVTANSSTPAVGPPSGSGWQLVGSASGSTMQTALWSKTAQAADAGSTLSVPLTSLAKTAVQLVAYSGTAGPGWLDTAVPVIDGTSSSTRTTPKVVAAGTGSTLISYWANKSSGDNGWTTGPDVTVRSRTTGTGSGRITSVLGDTAPVSAGDSGQQSGTPLLQPDTKTAMWSVILKAGS